MLSLPQLPANPSTRSADAGESRTSQQAADADGGGFGQLLEQVADRPLPKKLRAELEAQIADGVPLDEVLANLVDGLDEAGIGLAPGMVPVLQMLLPPQAADQLGKLGGAKTKGVDDLAGMLAQADDGKADGEADGLKRAAAGDDSGADALLAKHKVSLAGRVQAVDLLNNAGATLNTTQATPLRGLELPSAMTALPAAATDGPDGLLIPQRVGDPQWGQALAQRVVWMVGQDKQVAELKLNPANLGPLEVKLTLHHDQASVSLLASSGAVRDALEQALPRLRDMLGQQNIQLAQADVGYRQAPGDGSAGAQGNGHGAGHADGERGQHPDTADLDSPTLAPLSAGRGLFDAYA